MTTANEILQMLRDPKCPTMLLAKYLGNTDEEVRAAIAGNPALNEAQQKQLAEDKNVTVLQALLNNPALSASNKACLDDNLCAVVEAGLSAKRKSAPAKKVAPAKKAAPARKAAAKPAPKKAVTKNNASVPAPSAPAPVRPATTWPFPTPGISKPN